jgi:hypothetical protein
LITAGLVAGTCDDSEMLGESPANCAFHLRTLAQYGFEEEAGDRDVLARVLPATMLGAVSSAG